MRLIFEGAECKFGPDAALRSPVLQRCANDDSDATVEMPLPRVWLTLWDEDTDPGRLSQEQQLSVVKVSSFIGIQAMHLATAADTNQLFADA
jgi:hypothetical protein